MTDELTENDNDLLSTFDARIWAERFVKRVTANPSIATSEGAMCAWFAGAIMAGFDHARSELPAGVSEADALLIIRALMGNRIEMMGGSGSQFYAYAESSGRDARTLGVAIEEHGDHGIAFRVRLEHEIKAEVTR